MSKISAEAAAEKAARREYAWLLSDAERQRLKDCWGWVRSRDWRKVGATAFAVWKGLISALLNMMWLALASVIIIYAYQTLTRRTVAIDAISVPKDLEERGFTAGVAAQRLRDAINAYVDGARTNMKHASFQLQSDELNFVIPSIGLSLDSLLSMARKFVRSGGRRDVSGDLTSSGGKLRLRLRLNGRQFYESDGAGDIAGVDSSDELFEAAKLKVLEHIHPYIVAADMLHRRPDQAMLLAQQKTAELPEWDDDVAWLYSLIGVLHYDRGDYERSETALNKALSLDRNLAVAHVNLGLLPEAKHEFDAAIAEYKSAVAIDQKLAIAHNNLGAVYEQQHKPNDARDEYRKAVGLDGTLALAHSNLAKTLLLINGKRDDPVTTEFTRAIEGYEETLKTYPDDANAYIALAGVLNAAGDDAKAAATFATAIKKLNAWIASDSTNPVLYVNLGNAWTALGKPDNAIAAYRKAVAANASYAKAHFQLALALQGKKDPPPSPADLKEAAAEYQKVIDAQPNNAIAHYDLGLVLQSTGDEAQAKKHYQDAVRIDPKYAPAHVNLGRMLGNPDDALLEFRKAIEADPRDIVAYENLLRFAQSANKSSEAIRIVRAVLQRDQGNTIAQGQLERLEASAVQK